MPKILIANRGEIAVRIIHACRQLGYQTVAVYAEADAETLPTRLADTAVLLGPAIVSESYLRGDKLIAMAQAHGCQAIHPGYGFLAENASFAEAVQQAGLCFIGPSPEAIRLMGSKTEARARMAQAGVPIVPGYQESSHEADLAAAAHQLGYPVLIKAAAGGGGKGMRVVETAAEFGEQLAAARREATHAFGDDRVYVEKYIRQPHHVEFQIFGDSSGEVVHLYERECSIQRRHQKIIEETPSPNVTAELRQQMATAAIHAAKAVHYTNVGTVEFLVDGASSEFYFLEMNTRLQVEHAITEKLCGVDLVVWQLRQALGDPNFRVSQQAIQPRGHAIEGRIYAEDAAQGFLPSTGKLLRVIFPSGPFIRVDTGVQSGDVVTHYYDPMIAKLIVWAETRAEAIRAFDEALRQTVILGEVTTNIPFLRAIINHPAFIAGDTPTNFIEHHLPTWQPSTEPPAVVLIAAALSEPSRPITPSPPNIDPYSPWRSLNDFRVG